MRTIAFTNQKGGISKTTSTYNFSVWLHNRGFRVVVVDFDPQSNLSATAADHKDGEQATLYDVLKGNCTVFDALSTTRPVGGKAGMGLLSVGLQATAADMELSGQVAREYMLKSALEPISGDYDYCVIDTAPSLGLLTLNALTAADLLIIPLCLDSYSLQGIEQLNGYISNIRHYTNSNLRISGLLVTKYNDRLNISQALKNQVEQAAKMMGTQVFDTKIRECVAVREAQLVKQDIYSYAPKATATLDYIAFVEEFLSMEG